MVGVGWSIMSQVFQSLGNLVIGTNISADTNNMKPFYRSLSNYFMSNSQRMVYFPQFIRKLSSKREGTWGKIKQTVKEFEGRLQWRRTILDDTNRWQSKFKVFADDEQNSDFISLMQQPVDLSPSAVKQWWKNRDEYVGRRMQQYISERHEILGSDLGAAHFIIHRGGAIKFLNRNEWTHANQNYEYNLPTVYNPGWEVEAIRCDKMTLYYEGLENISNLQSLKFLSLINVKTFDDWCLDRISGAQNPLLEVLDLTGTNITWRGLSALYRISSLKVLVINSEASEEFELSCALLEDIFPKLKVYGSKHIHYN